MIEALIALAVVGSSTGLYFIGYFMGQRACNQRLVRIVKAHGGSMILRYVGPQNQFFHDQTDATQYRGELN